jgi:DNA polymerase
MLIGEAPGQYEIIYREPFVGRAGQLLDHVLEKIGVGRSNVYVTNILKCRPPDNKLPKAKELSVCIEKCAMYLEDELDQVKPKVVVLLGGTAVRSMLSVDGGLLDVEGSVYTEANPAYFTIRGLRFVPCVHPAYVLRSPSKEVNLARALYRAAKLAGLKPRTKGFSHGLFDYDNFGPA